MSRRLDFEQWLPAPIERAFRFFCDPNNLPLISPPASDARLVRADLVPPPVPNRESGAPTALGLAGIGSELEISVRLLPFLPARANWVARVVEFEWDRQFRDLQIRGPFKKWDHRHIFESVEQAGQAGTILRDVVEYDVGWGALGWAANRLFVERQIRDMFAFRQQAAARLLLR